MRALSLPCHATMESDYGHADCQLNCALIALRTVSWARNRVNKPADNMIMSTAHEHARLHAYTLAQQRVREMDHALLLLLLHCGAYMMRL